jgi:tetratricopeptide (TPR) repeat protein
MANGSHGRASARAVLVVIALTFAWSNLGQSSQAMTDASWNNLARSATDALDSNKYWIAEPLLKQSISEAEKFGFSDMRLARAYGELGRYYQVRGRFEDAQPWYERELAVKEVAYENDQGKLVQPMGALVVFYLNYGAASKADPMTEDLLAIVEGKMRAPREKAQGKAKYKKGDTLEGWLGTAAPVVASPMLDWAISCDNIGNAYRAKGNFKLAERLYKAAFDVKTAVLGQGHLALANSYDNLAGLAVEKGDLQEAENNYRDALETTQKTLSSDSPEVYSRLDKLAKCLIKEKKFSQAEELYLRALTFWKTEPCKTGEEARAYYALGSLYVDQKKYAEGANYLSQALDLAEKFSGPCQITLVPYLQRYAYALYYLGRRDEGSVLNARARTISGEPS